VKSVSCSPNKELAGDVKVRGIDLRIAGVRPFRDPDDGDDDDEGGAKARLSYITPRNDTLIEREIRITRQREGSLRRVRGYPAVNQQTAVEVPLSGFGRRLQATSPPSSALTSPRAPHQDDEPAIDDNVAMKRMATNRLRLEILRERKREVDLRSQGKIYTISEEHIERPPLLAELVAASANTSPRDVNSARSNDSDAKNDADGHQQATSPGARRRQQQQQQQQQQQHPKYARQPQHEEMGRRRMIGEKLIEQEVRELRRREQELRLSNSLRRFCIHCNVLLLTVKISFLMQTTI